MNTYLELTDLLSSGIMELEAKLSNFYLQTLRSSDQISTVLISLIPRIIKRRQFQNFSPNIAKSCKTDKRLHPFNLANAKRKLSLWKIKAKRYFLKNN